jgi:selenide,water dikinase
LPLKETFAPEDYPNLLVGLSSADDAAVWRLNAKQSLVVTTDFFTPIVDDPYDYGAIAAANSLSDVYAMGGKPILALNIAALPVDLPIEMTQAIFRGGAEKAKEAGVVIAGGHTVKDAEPKYGLAVIGLVDQHRMLTKGGAKPGDVLVLTKPLGFGVTATAFKRGLTTRAELDEMVSWMKTLNAAASQVAVANRLKGGTDVTGYSLLGHATEMADASGVGIRFEFDKIPFTSAALKYAELYTFPGGASDNALYFGPKVRFDPRLNEGQRMLLFDPQTSGGLLLAVPQRKLTKVLAQMTEAGAPAWVIGRVTQKTGVEVI